MGFLKIKVKEMKWQKRLNKFLMWKGWQCRVAGGRKGVRVILGCLLCLVCCLSGPCLFRGFCSLSCSCAVLVFLCCIRVLVLYSYVNERLRRYWGREPPRIIKGLRVRSDPNYKIWINKPFSSVLQCLDDPRWTLGQLRMDTPERPQNDPGWIRRYPGWTNA